MKRLLLGTTLTLLVGLLLVGCAEPGLTLTLGSAGPPGPTTVDGINVVRGATFVVAASDSSPQSRAQADYVADGVDDQVEIQAAIDTLPAGGGTVLLLEGTYLLEGDSPYDSSIVIMPTKDSVSLIGSGFSTVLKVVDNYTGGATMVLGTSQVEGYRVDNFRVAHLKIDGNYENAGAADMKGIIITFSTNTVVENVWVYKMQTYGIMTGGATYGTIIRNNVVEECFDGQIGVFSSKYALVEGNRVLVGSRSTLEGIPITDSEYSIITNNYVEANAIAAITPHYNSSHTIISNNTIKASGTARGIYFRGEISPGGEMNHNTITGNYINGAYRGISMELGEASVMSYNLIAGNMILNSQREGIFLQGVSHNRIHNNFVVGSSQEADNTYDNIYLEDSDYNYVSDNSVRWGDETNKSRYGVNISNAGCDNNIVKDNDLYDAGSTANLNDGGTGTIVEGNRE